VHDRTEAVYVIGGELALWIDDDIVVHRPGSYIVVAPGRRHAIWNPADEPAVYLTVISPKGFERYLAELAKGLREATSPDAAAALRSRLGMLYDITVVGPPPDRR
jgi:oxalate decarboxylase/phosphoglucose isomerase-like protein (cupin superfamily)